MSSAHNAVYNTADHGQDDIGRGGTTFQGADDQLAAQFGYVPVFKRDFGLFSSLSFAFSVGGLFTALMTTFAYPLAAGGSAAVVWCWAIAGLGCLCIAASVAELVSAYPTSGGLYFTISRTAPLNWVPIVSWITGWLNILGQVAAVAATEYGATQLFLSAIAIGTDFSFTFSVRTVIGVMAGFTVLNGVVNSMSTKWMEKLTRVYVLFHVTVIVTCMITLLAVEKNKHSAKYVFTNVESASGWEPVGFSFLFGFLSVAFVMTDYDATAHIAEEINNPEIQAPKAIWWAMVMSYVLGLLLNIVLCFCMHDPADILLNQVGQPVAQIFYDSLGKSGGLAFTCCGVVIIQFTCITCLQSLSRTIFAFSRDGLLPLSSVWTTINSTTGTPIYAVWIGVVLSIVINLIGLGSYTAIAAVFNTCPLALDWSYCIPIACKLFSRRYTPGPWSMGRLSKPINAIALIWTTFVSVIFFLPTVRPVTAANMNYAIVIFAILLLFASAYWYTSGRKSFEGPRPQEPSGLMLHNSRVSGLASTSVKSQLNTETAKAV